MLHKRVLKFESKKSGIGVAMGVVEVGDLMLKHSRLRCINILLVHTSRGHLLIIGYLRCEWSRPLYSGKMKV